jgi:hypothetical protein
LWTYLMKSLSSIFLSVSRCLGIAERVPAGVNKPRTTAPAQPARAIGPVVAPVLLMQALDLSLGPDLQLSRVGDRYIVRLGGAARTSIVEEEDGPADSEAGVPFETKRLSEATHHFMGILWDGDARRFRPPYIADRSCTRNFRIWLRPSDCTKLPICRP